MMWILLSGLALLGRTLLRNSAGTPTKTPVIRVLNEGVWNLGCTLENTGGSTLRLMVSQMRGCPN
jgi:hypothetical protein